MPGRSDIWVPVPNVLVGRTEFIERLDRDSTTIAPWFIGALLPAVAGNPWLVHDTRENQYYVAYRNAQGQIQEASFQEGEWRVVNPTVRVGAPLASGDPVGLVAARNGARYYVYRGQQGHIHELGFDGSWSHRDLTLAAQRSGK